MAPTGDPIRVALEYIDARDSMVERHLGAGRVLMGNASKPTQYEFIRMCNGYAARFANEMPLDWDESKWKSFSDSGNRDAMQHALDFTFPDSVVRIDNLAVYEACVELSRTYLSILRQRTIPT